MPYDSQKPPAEVPNPNAYATPEQLADFVNESLLAFAEKGKEFYDPDTTDPNYPEYLVEDIPYDEAITPNLTPYDTCSIKALDNGDPDDTGLSSAIFYAFKTKVVSPSGERQLVRDIMMYTDGTITDDSSDATPTPEKAKQWEDLADMTREERREVFKEITGRQAIQASIREFEGVPEAPQAITLAELEDLRKLLPVTR